MNTLSHFKVATASLLIATAHIAPLSAFSQSHNGDTQNNIVTKIIEESNGNVVIEIPEAILQQILTPAKTQQREEPGLRPGINKMQGYRIQVFSDGRNQSSLEARAKARGSAVLAKFPKYRGQIYTYSQSPSWYTRVGNFRSQSEANAALAELKRAFPNFASEMRVVKCKIVVIKQ